MCCVSSRGITKVCPSSWQVVIAQMQRVNFLIKTMTKGNMRETIRKGKENQTKANRRNAIPPPSLHLLWDPERLQRAAPAHSAGQHRAAQSILTATSFIISFSFFFLPIFKGYPIVSRGLFYYYYYYFFFFAFRLHHQRKETSRGNPPDGF